MSINPLLNIAIKATRSASRIILKAVDHLDTVKIAAKEHNDFVTEIDQAAEQEIIRVIHDSYPDHAILGEEGGAHGDHDYTWIIDPIDGTNNFIHNHPHFCTSIAIKYRDHIEHGLIYDHLRQELFTASAGVGAFLNEHRIRVSSRKNFNGATVGSCFSVKSGEIGKFIRLFAAILPYAAGTRRSGSGALDCAYVACGRLDAMWGLGFKPWDIAAGALIIKEAGGLITDFQGVTNEGLPEQSMIAANPALFKMLFQLIQQAQVTE